eukprot:TRINITY_DN95_c0_g1_i1.p2 TRINITY_DN95_c0_g1~~TRINITY_DN95_c0_g1_i1.p2  ORF type:complete len:147 (-),score=26.15 TRINITY_DN95_c0_g1_i1:444-884(-)
MASIAACKVVAPVAGLSGSSLTQKAKASRVQLKSEFLGGIRSKPQIANVSGQSRVTCFTRDWLRTDLSVIGFGLIGWIAPSSLPLINGDSLTGLFLGSIGPELAHFPTGPALDSPFWFYLLTWHLGLFLVLFYGQIGFKGRSDGYF